MARSYYQTAWLRRRRHRLLNAAAAEPETLPTYAWAPFDLPGTLLYLSAGQLQHQFVELNTTAAPGLTRVAAATDLVGQVASPVNGHLARAPADASRPTYRTGPPRWEFDGTADRFSVQNTASAFNALHETGVGTILIRVGVRSSGANRQIIDNMNWSSANRGVTLARTSANTVQFQAGRGVAAQFLFNFTSTEQLVAATGIANIEIRFSNAAGGDFRLSPVGGALGTLRTFARLNAPATGNAAADLFIGKSSTASLFGDIDVQDLLISDQYLSDADVALWRAWAPGVDEPATYLRQVALPGEGVPCFNFLHRWYDFTAPATLWQNTARSTPVASDDDPIRVVDHRGDDATQRLARTIVAPSDDARALFQADGDGALFDGTDDDYVCNDSSIGGGARTWVFVWRNDDPTFGSHLAQGTGYVTATGENYDGNPAFEGAAYTILHVSGVEPSVGQVTLGTPTGFNVLAISRNGSTWHSAMRGAGVARETGPEISAGAFAIDSFGASFLVDPWEFDGRYVAITTYQEALTPEQLQVEIANAVANFPSLGL